MPPLIGHTIPEEWLAILRTVQVAHPQAVLAGGALRDLVLGGEVKDLDVFVPADTGSEHLLPGNWHCFSACSAEYVPTFREEVDATLTFMRPEGGLPVNIVYLKLPHWSPMDVIRRCDFGACQVGTDGDTTYLTNAALRDLVDRRITLLPCQDALQTERSLKRGRRFEEKYAGTDVVVDVSAAAFWLNQMETTNED